MTRSLVSVQRAGKVDKIIHPVNGHPGKLLAAKVCRKLFLRVEKVSDTGYSLGLDVTSRGKEWLGRT